MAEDEIEQDIDEQNEEEEVKGFFIVWLFID